MEQAEKTTVSIIQELIAIHSTRVEASSRLETDENESSLRNAGVESEKFLEELLSELSQYGDAVSATAERNNAYQDIWTKNLTGIEGLDPAQKLEIFANMENSLATIYAEILLKPELLHASLLEMIRRQKQVVKH